MDGPGDEDWIPPEASPHRNSFASQLYGASPTPPRRPRDKSLLDRTGYIGRRTTPEPGSPSVLLSPAPRDKVTHRVVSRDPRGWEAETSQAGAALERHPPAIPPAPPGTGKNRTEAGHLVSPLSPSRAWGADGAWGGVGSLVSEGRGDEGGWGHTRDTCDRWERKLHEALRRRSPASIAMKPLHRNRVCLC